MRAVTATLQLFLVSTAFGQTLYWADVGTRVVQRGDLGGDNLEILLEDQFGPRGFDIDIANDRVYFADDSSFGSNDDAIRAANLDGSGMVTLTEATTPYALTLDLANDLIYFSDTSGISKCNLDGTDLETVITTSTVARDIHINNDTGKIYWAESSMIRRANLDGSSNEPLYLGPFVSIYNVEFDFDDDRMYWTESAFGFADIFGSGIEIPKGESADERSDVQLIDVGTILKDPRGLVLDDSNGMLTWSDRVDDVIRRAPSDGGIFEELVTAGLVNPVNVRLDHVNDKLYWSDYGTDSIRRTGINGQSIRTIVGDLNFPVDVSVDFCGAKIYWADSGIDAIRRSDFDGANVESVVELMVDDIQALALDAGSGMLYWTDNASDRVLRAATEVPQGETPGNRTDIETLVSGVQEPSGLAIDSDGGYLFWADRFSNRVLRAGIDIPKGQTPETRDDVIDVATDLDDPWAVTLDVGRARVYWVDAGTNRLQSASMDGGDVQNVVTTGMVDPRGLSFDAITDTLVWTDRSLQSISRADIDGMNVSALYGEPLDDPRGILVASPTFSLSDHQSLINCFLGPEMMIFDVCSCNDLNVDGFIDLRDIAVQQNVITLP